MKRTESIILRSGFILAGFETRGKLLAPPSLYFSPLQKRGVMRGWTQASQTCKTACRTSQGGHLCLCSPWLFSVALLSDVLPSHAPHCQRPAPEWSFKRNSGEQKHMVGWEAGRAFGPQALGAQGCFLTGRQLELYQVGGPSCWQVPVECFPEHT